jgi:hypothetical protein
MSVVEITSRPIWQPFKRLISLLAGLRRPSLHTEHDEAENRARRTFILEMMDAYPEAFQHENDCQTMMGFYPSRF